jgi:lipopolysaccharide export system permease protein
MLKLLDRYIIKNFLLTFVVLLGAFSAIAIVIDLTEKIKDFVSRKVPVIEIVYYFKNFLPFILALLFPIFIFVAVIFFTSRLANRSEIIAMLNSGMNFTRFLRPYVIGAGIISIVLFFANHYVIPRANKSRLQFEEKYLWERKYRKDDNFHMRIGPNEYIYMQSYNPESKTGYRFSYEKVQGTKLIQKITADRITFDSTKKEWKLFDAIARNNNGPFESMIAFPYVYKNFSFKPTDLIERREIKQMMTAPQLNAYIQKELNKGSENLNEYFIEKYRRTAAPWQPPPTATTDRITHDAAGYLDEAVVDGSIPPIDTAVTGVAWFGALNEVVARWLLADDPGAGKTIIKPDEAKELDALIDVVYGKPFATALLSGCTTELCLQWTDPDYGPAKARLDGYTADNGGALIELKTARSITDRSFAGAFYSSLGYDIQLGWYAHGLQANNMPVADVWIVAVQTQEELDCRVLHIPKLVLDEGYAKARRLAIEYRACEALKDWPGIDGGKDYTEFVPPVWAVGNEDMSTGEMEGGEL